MQLLEKLCYMTGVMIRREAGGLHRRVQVASREIVGEVQEETMSAAKASTETWKS
jgi:hypothetical protein